MANDFIDDDVKSTFDRLYRPIKPGSWEEKLERSNARKSGDRFGLEAKNRLCGFVAWKSSNWRGMNAASERRYKPANENAGVPIPYRDIAGEKLVGRQILSRNLRTWTDFQQWLLSVRSWYGPGSTGPIPGGSTLLFKVELLKVKTPKQ